MLMTSSHGLDFVHDIPLMVTSLLLRAATNSINTVKVPSTRAISSLRKTCYRSTPYQEILFRAHPCMIRERRAWRLVPSIERVNWLQLDLASDLLCWSCLEQCTQPIWQTLGLFEYPEIRQAICNAEALIIYMCKGMVLWSQKILMR